MKFFRVLFLFMIILCVSCNNYAIKSERINHDLSSLSCNDLLVDFIKNTTLHNKYTDKKNVKELYFERTGSDNILLTFVGTKDQYKGMVFGNYELNLSDQTLKYIDPYPAVSIKINKEYIPFIAKKCTPEQNIYRRGKLPDP